MSKKILSSEVGFFLLLLAAALLVTTLRATTHDDLVAILDNDSAMRLVQVRDLLAGQEWFDLTQSRLGFEPGIEMHWSRLIDGIMAGIVLLFSLLMPTSSAEVALLILWPAFWAAVTLWASMDIAHRLGGPFVMFPALTIGPMVLLGTVHFAPGSIDHHNIQIALMALALCGFVARHSGIAYPAMAGAAVAASMVIGVELLPLLAVYCLFFSAVWITGGHAERDPAIHFAAALSISLVILFLLTAPASAYTGGYCDAVSIDLLLPVLGCALSLLLIATFGSGAGMVGRFAILGASGAFVIATTVLVSPACFLNPLASLDPFLYENWLSNVEEAQGIGALAKDLDLFALWGCALALGAIAICFWLIALGRSRSVLWMLVLLISTGFLVASYQVRAIPVLAVVSLPPWILLAAQFRKFSRRQPGVAAQLLAVGVILFSTPHAWAFMDFAIHSAAKISRDGQGSPAQSPDKDHGGCFENSEFQRISAFPAGLVSSTSNLGSQILLQSRHRVLSAPYHRNQAGMIAQLEIAFSESAADAERRLAELDVDYLVLCAVDPEIDLGYNRNGGAKPLFAQLVHGDTFLPNYPLAMRSGDVFVFQRVNDG